jgi:hypothetical protein
VITFIQTCGGIERALLVHDLLARENWAGAGLLDLVNGAMQPFEVANGRAERFVITGKNIRLPPVVSCAVDQQTKPHVWWPPEIKSFFA